MNRRAQALGLKTARFRNSTGLPDPDHVISALDLARLAAHIIREFPDLYRLYSEPALSFNGKKQENRNPLLGRFEGADGVKTGHTAASGYGLIGSAVLNGQRRIIVFNGLPTMAARASEAQRLMRAAFFDFEARRLFEKGAAVGAANVFLGGRKDVGLVTALPIYIAAHRSVAAGMKASIVYDGPIPAPVKAGEEVARLVIEAPGAQPVSYPLLAARGVGKANWFALAGAGIARTLGAGP
jgi:D-alanyl-D-alanine carboxypeptidase (penicillin-binding protein 5/6)